MGLSGIHYENFFSTKSIKKYEKNRFHRCIFVLNYMVIQERNLIRWV